jgi:hypothetical protein
LLDGAGGIKILGEAGVLEMTFVVDGVFESDGGLEDEAFEEIALVEAERASFRSRDDEFREDLFAVAGEKLESGTAFGGFRYGFEWDAAVDDLLRGEKGSVQLEFAHGERGGLLEDVGQLDGGMDDTRGFEEGLEADDLFGEREAGLVGCVGLRVGLLEGRH